MAFHHVFYQISILEGCVITLVAESLGHLETKLLEFRNRFLSKVMCIDSAWLVAWSYHKHSPKHYEQGFLKIDAQCNDSAALSYHKHSPKHFEQEFFKIDTQCNVSAALSYHKHSPKHFEQGFF